MNKKGKIYLCMFNEEKKRTLIEVDKQEDSTSFLINWTVKS